MLSKRFSLLASSVVITALLAACSTTPPKSVETAPAQPPATGPAPAAGPVLRPVAFNAMPGWDRDDVREAWPAFLTSCEVMIRRAAWKEPCTVARTVDANSAGAIRTFFEAFFVPHQVFNPDGTDNGLITGYYEPCSTAPASAAARTRPRCTARRMTC